MEPPLYWDDSIIRGIMKIIQLMLENIDIIVAVAALLLSLYQFASTKIRQRVNFYIQIDNAQLFNNDPNAINLLLSIVIVNKSETPLIITRIYFIDGEKEYLCNLKKKWSGEHYYPKFPETDIPRTERILSADFPLNLQPFGATSEIVRFTVPSDINVKKGYNVKLKIVTDKKSIIIETECQNDKQALMYL